MTTTDYLINAVLILLVVRQIHGQRLDFRNLVLPLVLVGVAANSFLHTIPTAGNDLILIVGLATTGALLGLGAALATDIRPGADGIAVAKAGTVAAALWVFGISTRVAFSFASDHGAGHAIAHFSVVNHITGSDAWTAALVLMALAEVVTRVLALYFRAQRVQSPARPVLAAA